MPGNQPIAEIHLDHIRANYQLAKTKAPDCHVMAVIKANAYGHGVAEVANILSDADAFAVARVSEGIELRRYTNNRIVVLEGFLDAAELASCVEHTLIPMVHSDHQLDILPLDLAFWLKFNTGMSRLGFPADRAEELANKVAESALIGVASHLANADMPAHKVNQRQLHRLELIGRYFPDAPFSFANSGAILGIEAAHRNWVRPGLMLYGGSPSGRPINELAPGMTLKAPIIAINSVEAGDAVGYGSTWQAANDCRIAVVGLGYADGYPREVPPNCPVIVAGSRRGLVGRVSMDMCTVLLDSSDQAKVGDYVEFWGENLPIDEIAEWVGSISYTLMTGLGGRVQRIYQGSGSETGNAKQ